MIYLVYFAASAFFAHLSVKAENQRKRTQYAFFSIAIMVLLAGLRNYSIGTDVDNYRTLERYWVGATQADSVLGYLRYYFSVQQAEPLFAMFVGVVAQLTGNFRVFLFFAHGIIVTCMYIGAFRLKHHARPELVLLLFYLFYFNNSLNLIRQYMAMALVFAFFADLEQRKFVRYIAAVLVAAMIHTTAVLSLCPLVIYLFLFPKKELDHAGTVQTVIACTVIVLGAVFLVPLLKLAMSWGILSTKYQFYFQNQIQRRAVTRLILRVLEIVGLIVCYRTLREKQPHLEFYLVNTVLFLSLLETSRALVYGQRIPLHFGFANLVTVAMLGDGHKRKSMRVLWTTAIVLLAAYYWYHTYVLGMGSETIPYRFGS